MMFPPRRTRSTGHVFAIHSTSPVTYLDSLHAVSYSFSASKSMSLKSGLIFLLSVFTGLILAIVIRQCLLGSYYLCVTGDGPREDEAFKYISMERSKFPHNSDTNLVFVGIMTAQQFLDTRAPAVYESWATEVPGKVAIFAKEDAVTTKDIPIIRLPGTDDAYPPQKKSFMMLKYMYDNFLDHFEFFMRTDDDVYIRPDRLEKFLRSVNSSKMHYIGQMGKGNTEEFGLLSLLDYENYCMGGPGMILSRATLARIGPHIAECLHTMHTDHEDVEVGRCIQRFAGVSCTWSYEMRHILYNIQNAPDVFEESLKQLEIRRAITLHPVKNHIHLYRLHHYLQQIEVQSIESKLLRLTRELGALQRDFYIPLPVLDDPASGTFLSHLADLPTLHPGHIYHESGIVPFSLLSKQEFSPLTLNPQHRVFSAFNESMYDVIRHAMEDVNEQSMERGRDIEFRSMLYGYSRQSPGTSIQYILDLLLLYKKFRGKKMTLPVRRHSYLQVPYGPLYVRELKDPSPVKPEGLPADSPEPPQEDAEVHFLLPLSGRLEIFTRFMRNYEQVVLERVEAATLTVVHYNITESGQLITDTPHAFLKALKLKYPGAILDIVEGIGPFSRAPALHLAAQQWPPSSLLFCLDVDMAFNEDLLSKIRLHTRQGKQAYFPIVFSEFDPSVAGKPPQDERGHTAVTEDSGYFRNFGYGIMSVYRSDLDAVGGFNISIFGWGGEDIDLFEKFIASRSHEVFRTCEVGLVHVYHPPACVNTPKEGDEEFQKAQAQMCRGSVYSTHASAQTLSRRLVAQPEILR